MATINIAREFSVYPGGRVPADGLYSGQEFRDNFLIPAMNANESVNIELDGTRGYGSSFLEEAFGGLVRVCGFLPEQILGKFIFVSKKPSLVEEIRDYIISAGVSQNG